MPTMSVYIHMQIVLKALRRSGQSLPEWLGDLKMYPQKMINVPLTPGIDWQTHAGLARARAEVEADLGDRGRVLIRASGTEPKLRLMVEAADKELAERSAKKLAAVSEGGWK